MKDSRRQRAARIATVRALPIAELARIAGVREDFPADGAGAHLLSRVRNDVVEQAEETQDPDSWGAISDEFIDYLADEEARGEVALVQDEARDLVLGCPAGGPRRVVERLTRRFAEQLARLVDDPEE